MTTNHQITASDIEAWGSTYIDRNAAFKWFADVMNGEYPIQKAKQDCLSYVEHLERMEEEE